MQNARKQELALTMRSIAGYLQKVSAASEVALGGATTSEFLHIWLNFFDHIMNNHWYHQNHCTFLFPMMYLSSQSIQVGPWSNLYLIQAFLLLSLDQGWIHP